jgi:hypothetical protein
MRECHLPKQPVPVEASLISPGPRRFDNNRKLETAGFRAAGSSSCRLLSRSEDAVKGGANCFVVRGVHRSEAQTLIVLPALVFPFFLFTKL